MRVARVFMAKYFPHPPRNVRFPGEFGPDALLLFRDQSGTEQMAISKLLTGRVSLVARRPFTRFKRCWERQRPNEAAAA
jgi:hypothetical protein